MVLRDLFILTDSAQNTTPWRGEDSVKQPPDEDGTEDANDCEKQHVRRRLAEIHQVTNRYRGTRQIDSIAAV